eukprot:31463-Pelagococcus_subviridis.AAC.1
MTASSTSTWPRRPRRMPRAGSTTRTRAWRARARARDGGGGRRAGRRSRTCLRERARAGTAEWGGAAW